MQLTTESTEENTHRESQSDALSRLSEPVELLPMRNKKK